jgi:hypothetical protein
LCIASSIGSLEGVYLKGASAMMKKHNLVEMLRRRLAPAALSIGTTVMLGALALPGYAQMATAPVLPPAHKYAPETPQQRRAHREKMQQWRHEKHERAEERVDARRRQKLEKRAQHLHHQEENIDQRLKNLDHDND